MSKIKGIKVLLHTKEQVGVNEFNEAVYEERIVDVDNVLIAEPSSNDLAETTSLYSRRAQYTLCIPKGDSHDWENVIVEFFGQNWKTIGIPTQGIEENIPLDWNKKVQVERCE